MDANFDINCPACDQLLAIDEELMGACAPCPACGQELKIPGYEEFLEALGDDEQGGEMPPQADEASAADPQSSQSPSDTYRRDTKTCPFCGESILLVAVKCRFCGEFLTRPKGQADGVLTIQQTSKKLKAQVVISGAMFVIGLIISSFSAVAMSTNIPVIVGAMCMTVLGLVWHGVAQFLIWWHHK